MATQDKYLIKYKNEDNTDRQTQFDSWDECSFFVDLLDERKLSYKVYEKQNGQWVEILQEEGK